MLSATPSATSRGGEATKEEDNLDKKPERPKPPKSLLTDTLKAAPAPQIPIVSPDRSVYKPHTLTAMCAATPLASSATDGGLLCGCSPQTDREKDPDYDSLPSQTSQSESSMLQVICRPEATNKEEAYTFHTVHRKRVHNLPLNEPPEGGADGFTVNFSFFFFCLTRGQTEKTLRRESSQPTAGSGTHHREHVVQLVFTFKQQCLRLVHTTCHHSVPSLPICPPCSDLLSTSSNSECQDGLGGHTDCPFQRRIIPAHRLRPRRTHPEIFQVFNLDHRFKFFPVAKQPAKEKKYVFFTSGRGLVGRLVRHVHSGEAHQEDLLQTQTLSWEVDQYFVRQTHTAGSTGQVRPPRLP